MSNPSQPQDPLEFLKSMWRDMGFALPGMVVPTLDIDELDRRIAELKAVEGWLKLNLGMLQMNLQGMEMQRATLAAMQALNQSGAGAEKNPLGKAGVWPWDFMSQAIDPGSATPAPPPAPEDTAADKK